MVHILFCNITEFGINIILSSYFLVLYVYVELDFILLIITINLLISPSFVDNFFYARDLLQFFFHVHYNKTYISRIIRNFE